jgi:mitogen-activated protein kinase organizer 1
MRKLLFFRTDPVTSVIPTQDESTYLVMTLDGHIRLMDAITGKLLNDFSSHVHTSYRCRACFGHGEASVVAGDENGAIWAWDLLDVSSLTFMHTGDNNLSTS